MQYSYGFLDYMLKNYIDFDANFGPELWANKPDNSLKTNQWS